MTDFASLFQPTHRGNFRSGYTSYVGFLADQHPDVYWDPRQGIWVSLPPGQWAITDKGLPSVQADAISSPDEIFDRLISQWSSMSADDHRSAYWDPRRKRWIVAVSGAGAGKDWSITQRLVQLDQMYRNGTITWAEYIRLRDDALQGRLPDR